MTLLCTKPLNPTEVVLTVTVNCECFEQMVLPCVILLKRHWYHSSWSFARRAHTAGVNVIRLGGVRLSFSVCLPGPVTKRVIRKGVDYLSIHHIEPVQLGDSWASREMAQSENAPGSAGRRQLQDILKTRILSAVTVMSHSPSLENIQDALTGRQEKAGTQYIAYFSKRHIIQKMCFCVVNSWTQRLTLLAKTATCAPWRHMVFLFYGSPGAVRLAAHMPPRTQHSPLPAVRNKTFPALQLDIQNFQHRIHGREETEAGALSLPKSTLP